MSAKECEGLYVRCCECGVMINESEWEAHAATPCATAEGGRDARIAAAAPELLEACEYAFDFIPVVRARFPISMRNQDKYRLELVSSLLSRATHKAKGGAS